MATALQLDGIVRRERGQFSPEFELLLACCQPDPDNHRLTQVLQSPINWDAVLRLSEHHRMLPALREAVNGREDLPGSIQSALRSRFQSHALKALRFSAELARIARAFTDSGIDVLAHKGPGLAQLLYGDPAMRQFGDLDLLVRPRNVVRAKVALRQLGYEPHLQLSPRQEHAYLHSGYEHVFGLNAERNLLELQWQILPRFYAIEFDLETMFKRSVEVTVEGFRMRCLCPEDLMLVLCVHAAKHGWAHLGMLRDIAALADFEMDWNWIRAEAGRIGINRILDISLGLAYDLFGVAWPQWSGQEIEEVEKITSDVLRNLTFGEELDTQSLSYFHRMMQTRERWQDRLLIASRLTFTPSVGEWQALRIPDPLFPLYRAVRIGRLLKRAVSG
jgi:Uncharacterised nucleotidyltransferase